jgi:hypothetical protein
MIKLFMNKLIYEWKIVIGTISVMALGISLLLVHGNLIVFPEALLFGAGAMWASGGILSMFWIIQIIRKRKRSEKEK